MSGLLFVYYTSIKLFLKKKKQKLPENVSSAILFPFPFVFEGLSTKNTILLQCGWQLVIP